MSDAEHTVVAGMLQRPSRLVDLGSVRAEFFSEDEPRKLYGFALGFHKKRGRKNAMDLALCRAKLEQSASKVAPALLALVAEYEGYDQITDAEFREGLDQVVIEFRQETMRTRGSAALEAMVDGDYDLAESEMRGGLIEVADAELEDDRPVNIRSPEAMQEERERVERKASSEIAGFDVGFPRLMRAVKFRRKELTIIGGFASDGKTQFSKSLAYNANQNGATVIFVALEMSREEVRAMFVAQHAATLDRRGVNWVDALDNNLSATHKKLWHRALDDFEIKTHDDHDEILSAAGALIVWAPTKRINQNDWTARLRAAKHEDGIDIGVKDYTELVKPAPKKGFANYRLDLKEMVEEDKALARELDILVIDNHQISRKGRDDAEKRKPPHYRMCDLGESSGLERAADNIGWIYSDQDTKDDREAIIGLSKARKGRQIVHGYHVYADFAKSIVAEVDHDSR